MADAPKTEKRVLLPQYLPGKQQFRKNGAPSGAADAMARVSVTLDPFPYWITGIRVVNVYAPGEQASLVDVANLATSRIDELQEIRLVIGTYEVFPFTAQELIVGKKGELWHPFPVRLGIRQSVNIVLEARRLVDYPLDIIPELAIVVLATSLRPPRPTEDMTDSDVLT